MGTTSGISLDSIAGIGPYYSTLAEVLLLLGSDYEVVASDGSGKNYLGIYKKDGKLSFKNNFQTAGEFGLCERMFFVCPLALFGRCGIGKCSKLLLPLINRIGY